MKQLKLHSTSYGKSLTVKENVIFHSLAKPAASNGNELAAQFNKRFDFNSLTSN